MSKIWDLAKFEKFVPVEFSKIPKMKSGGIVRVTLEMFCLKGCILGHARGKTDGLPLFCHSQEVTDQLSGQLKYNVK